MTNTIKPVVIGIGNSDLLGEKHLIKYCYILEVALDVVNSFKNESEMR